MLERKRRRPALEDEAEQVVARVRAESSDPPRKRVDTCVNGAKSLQYAQISEGSPITPRRQPLQYDKVAFLFYLHCTWQVPFS